MNNSIQHLLQEIEVLQRKYQLQYNKWYFVGLQQRASTHLTYTSNALEWNTLTEQETSLIINDGISVWWKKTVEIQEAINHAKAIDYILSRPKTKTLNNVWEQELCQIHSHILHDIQPQYAGIYRNVPVRIQGSQTILPNYAKVPLLMREREEKIKNHNTTVVLLAIQAHYDIVTIHPFIDGNGRSARLFMNGIFVVCWYPLISIEPSQRAEYLSVLESYQTQWESSPYTLFMLTIVRDTLLYYTTL